MTTDWKALAAPFPEDDIEWLIIASNPDKSSSLVAPYLRARSIMDRLDAVVGPAHWKDKYFPGPAGGVMAQLGILVDDEWVEKHDVSEPTDNEPIKGAFTGAFKRAAVKWGIGRYLELIGHHWVDSSLQGRRVVIRSYPRVPAKYLPGQVVGPPPRQPDDDGVLPDEPHSEYAAPGAAGVDSRQETPPEDASPDDGWFDRLQAHMADSGVKPGDIATIIKGGFSEEGVAAWLRREKVSVKQLVQMALDKKPKPSGRTRP